ncbi:unnamed protein product [Strongylus vulgaris]|uniref:EF-hand domain-containing protein n=1 Tax=Strongylus vulgaris TaxID=40348 RepID=A0A3P7LEQ1_STRVU|nr:unnamed protein product [Strongylus vulgaris]
MRATIQDELRSVMQKMGQSPTEEELDAMFNAADQDHDGNIDFKEFLQIAHANPLSLSLKAVFEELDVDGDGYITSLKIDYPKICVFEKSNATIKVLISLGVSTRVETSHSSKWIVSKILVYGALLLQTIRHCFVRITALELG